MPALRKPRCPEFQVPGVIGARFWNPGCPESQVPTGGDPDAQKSRHPRGGNPLLTGTLQIFRPDGVPLAVPSWCPSALLLCLCLFYWLSCFIIYYYYYYLINNIYFIFFIRGRGVGGNPLLKRWGCIKKKNKVLYFLGVTLSLKDKKKKKEGQSPIFFPFFF